MTGKNRIMIYGPKGDGTYVVEFRTADGDALAISVPAGETLWATKALCSFFGGGPSKSSRNKVGEAILADLISGGPICRLG
jgi:hypothetical protein